MTKRLSPQLRWFLFQLRPLLQAHLLSVLLIVLASLTFLLDPLILKWLIDIVLPKRDARLLMVAVACIAGVYICILTFFSPRRLITFPTSHHLVRPIHLY